MRVGLVINFEGNPFNNNQVKITNEIPFKKQILQEAFKTDAIHEFNKLKNYLKTNVKCYSQVEIHEDGYKIIKNFYNNICIYITDKLTLRFSDQNTRKLTSGNYIFYMYSFSKVGEISLDIHQQLLNMINTEFDGCICHFSDDYAEYAIFIKV